ncbi:MAG: carboxypeptidase regulatory-like domain-containing protein [Armatimonadota bacterium]|nr:carboxypeptidase regulatory-like domain-containing protein [Armatimonadota bacterium]
MMSIRRCAGLTAFVMIVAGAMLTVTVGCGGGGENGGAGTGTVSGTVVHAATLQPLGEITVRADGASTSTGADGKFTLRGVPAGQQTLQVSAAPERGLTLPPGVDLTVTVTGGQTNQLSSPIQMIDAVDYPPNPPS